ncbi:neugrin [Vanacampus margaritifer]
MANGRLCMLYGWVRAVATPSASIFNATAPHRPSEFCRYASSIRRVGKARGQQNTSRRDEEEDDNYDENVIMEEVEDKLDALLEESMKKQKMIKYNIMHRKMRPPGSPERKLTWEAMETIRYLKQEHPDEWTVELLSESFSVSPDVIRRVVRTKFSPAPHRKAVQDAKVMSRLQHPALPSGEAATERSRQGLHAGRSLRQFLPPGNPEAALVPVAVHTDEPTTKASSLVSVPVMPPRDDAAAMTTWPVQDGSVDDDPAEAEDETWDGRVLSEEELEEFRDVKPASVLQVGNEVFDSNGQFLYRI